MRMFSTELRRRLRKLWPSCRSRASKALAGAVALLVLLVSPVAAQQTGGGVIPITAPFTGGGLFTGQLLGPDGSAAAPTYSFSSDTDVGMYRKTTNTGVLASAGFDILQWNASLMTSAVPILLPSGAVGAPSLAFSADATDGIYRRTDNEINVVFGGTEYIRFGPNTYRIDTDAIALQTLGFGTGIGSSPDAVISRDAANTLAQRNGTTAQIFRIYNTYTDASNYERGYAQWSGNNFIVGAEGAGSGSNRNVIIASAGTTSVFLSTSGTNRWQTTNAGHFLAVADNTYDIGASGATRPRNYYGAGAVYAGAGGVINTSASAPLGWNGGAQIYNGSGTPEGAITAPVGSLFLRSDGGAGTSFYVKESGSGNTGWVAK